MIKEVDEMIDGVLQWFSYVKRMENDRSATEEVD